MKSTPDTESQNKRIKKEIWKNVPGFAGYQASNHGRIKGSRGNVLAINLSRYGYVKYVFTGGGLRTTILGHKAVAITFIDKPKGKKLQINHINGIKTDNRPENLEWVTCKENIRHAVRLGLKTGKSGEENPAAKLTNEQVLDIKTLRASMQKSVTELCNMYNVTRGAIWYHTFRKTSQTNQE